MSKELRTATAIWFCSSCMSFEEHTNFEMISEKMVQGECSCGKKNLNYFPKTPSNDVFGIGIIDLS